MSKLLISIIVPVYNVEQYLKNCLDSLINQTYRNIEIICVNDGSTDSSLEILKKYVNKDNRIRLIDKLNVGVSLARNSALEVFKGDYLMFVDSDDWIELNTCETTLEKALKYKADVTIWPYIREFKTHSELKDIFKEELLIFDEITVREKLHRRMIGIVKEELSEPEKADALCTVWGKLYRSDIVKNSNLRFQDIREIGTYEDGFFNLEFLKYAKKAVFINERLYHYRKNNVNSVTTKYKETLFEQWLILFDMMKNYIMENNLNEEYDQALSNRMALSILGLGLNISFNHKSFYWKINAVKKILRNEKYREAYKTLTLNYFPIHWKIFYGCAKYNFATGVCILLCVIKKMIGKNQNGTNTSP